MSDSIFNDIKTGLGLAPDYTAFDSEIMMHSNSALTILCDLGVGPEDGFVIEGAENTWSELGLPNKQLSMVKTYLIQKVRLAFDPPTMGFHIDALKGQIQEQEYRLRERREATIEVEDSVWEETVL
jgi:hypothetical protein